MENYSNHLFNLIQTVPIFATQRKDFFFKLAIAKNKFILIQMTVDKRLKIPITRLLIPRPILMAIVEVPGNP